MKVRKAFTLIELTVVIAMILVLFTSVFIVLNPVKRFAESRNARREVDVQNILIAIKANQTNNGGTYLTSIAATTAGLHYVIGTNTSMCQLGCTAVATQSTCVDLTGLVSTGYLDAVPEDPSTGVAAFTDYYLTRNASGTITIGACDTELGEVIVVSR